MDITLTIPDADLQRVLDAVAGSFGYNPATDGTKGQFTKKYVINFLKRTTKGYEANLAANSAAQTVQQQPDIDIT